MKYYIAADGGGSKLNLILYDETFHLVNYVKVSGTNSFSKTPEQVVSELNEAVAQLFPFSIGEIESADLSVLRYEEELLKILKRHCTVKNYHSIGEGKAALAAAGTLYGVTAQSGTGSDAFLIQRDREHTIGGWGFVLGDEGSGYEVGMHSLRSAVYAFDGRGPKTILLDMLMEEWKITDPWEMVDVVHGNQDFRKVVASVARITARAAKDNDEVAIRIYEEAGHAMAHQVLTVLSDIKGNLKGPIVTSGGTWKGYDGMFHCFAKDIHAVYPEIPITYPIFEPVIGCIIWRCIHDGMPFAEIEDILRMKFEIFLYK